MPKNILTLHLLVDLCFLSGRIAVFTLMHVTSGVARLISGRAQSGLLTSLLEYLTILFKYFDFQY